LPTCAKGSDATQFPEKDWSWLSLEIRRLAATVADGEGVPQAGAQQTKK